MKILRLDVNQFGGLTDRHYELSETLNIFEGENESGKSTLWLFIKFMLYGMPKKGHPEREKAINRSTHTAFGSMTVLWKGQEYRIERSFSENSRGRCVIFNESGESVFAGSEPGEVMLGVPREIFENSCSIGQSLCTGLGGKQSASAIKNILASADENVDIEHIEKKLDGIRVSYRHKNGKGGKVYELSEKLSNLKSRFDKATEGHLKLVDLERSLEKNASDKAETEKTLEGIRQVRSKLQQIEILRRFDAQRCNVGMLSNLKAELDGFIRTSFTGDIPSPNDLAYFSLCIDNFDRAEKEYEERLQLLSRLEASADHDSEKAFVGEQVEQCGGKEHIVEAFKKAKSGMMLGIACCVLSVISMALGFLKLSLLPIFLSIGGLLLIIGITLLVLFANKQRKVMSPYGKRGNELIAYLNDCDEALNKKRIYDNKIFEGKTEVTTAQRHQSNCFSYLESVFKRYLPNSEVTLDLARAEYDRLLKCTEKYNDLLQRINRLEDSVSNEEKILASYNESELRASFPNGISELEKINISDIETRERFYKSSLDSLADRENRLRLEYTSYRVSNEDPSRLADEISECSKQYTEAEKYCQAIMTAIDGIRAASEALRGNVMPIIGKNAGKMMEYISEGGYSSINTGAALDVSISDGRGLTTTSDMMSGGTKDAAYLALRLSLMMQLYGRELPPVMMDETLCQLDDKRMRRIIALISKLCKDEGLQCLMFSCHSREAAACADMGISANIIEMPSLVGKN